MSARQWFLRGGGLAAAAVVLVIAVQHLLLGFEATPLIGRDLLEDLTSWMRRRPPVGAGLLGGIVLVVGSAGLWWSLVRSFGVDRRVITVRGDDGWTKIDRPSLEEAIERHLESIDRRVDVSARVGRDGSTRLAISTPDPSSTGPAADIRDGFSAFCQDRGVPCQVGRITVSVPRRRSGRRRVR